MGFWPPLVKLIIWFMVPFISVCGLASILGPSPSSWVTNFNAPTWLSSHANSNSGKITSNYKESSNISAKNLRSKIHGRNEDLAKQAVQVEHSVLLTPLCKIEAASPVVPPWSISDACKNYIAEINIQATNEAALLKGITLNSSSIVVSTLNEAHAPPMRKLQLEKVVATALGCLEAGLQSARAVIKEARPGDQSYDPEFTPVGPMYWNANAFHRSYLEMEKRFRVYVYKEGEPPLFHNGPCKSIYSTEGNFIHQMEINTQFRTKHPDQAHVFFVPFSVAKMVQFVYARGSHDFSPIRHTVRDYVNVISTKYPYWNRSLAADHFMLSCHDWGPEASFSVHYLGKNSIRVLCNANTSEGFKPEKDVSFPEINLQTGMIKGFVGGPSPSHRSILGFFAGGLHGPIRPILLKHWESKDEDMKIYRYLPQGVSYYDMLRNSKFCICPSGYEVASPRVVEAIYTGCVPVLISDHYIPPFSDVLNWKSFSVRVDAEDIPNLKKILMGISTRQYLRMYRRVLQVRKHFEVHSPPKRYDFFHMILHSVWLRRLNVRVGSHRPS